MSPLGCRRRDCLPPGLSLPRRSYTRCVDFVMPLLHHGIPVLETATGSNAGTGHTLACRGFRALDIAHCCSSNEAFNRSLDRARCSPRRPDGSPASSGLALRWRPSEIPLNLPVVHQSGHCRRRRDREVLLGQRPGKSGVVELDSPGAPGRQLLIGGLPVPACLAGAGAGAAACVGCAGAAWPFCASCSRHQAARALFACHTGMLFQARSSRGLGYVPGAGIQLVSDHRVLSVPHAAARVASSSSRSSRA